MQCNRAAARRRVSRLAKRLVLAMIAAAPAATIAGHASAEITNSYRLQLTVNDAPALAVSANIPTHRRRSPARLRNRA